MKKSGLPLLILVFMILLHASAQMPYHEKYRSQYHFSPLKGWTGDPDGLVKYKGVYHLFWWGHAISNDLVYWKEMSYPIKGNTNHDEINSGGAIIDTLNVAGFGKNARIILISIYILAIR
jgi:fructan beta-fructosidase